MPCHLLTTTKLVRPPRDAHSLPIVIIVDGPESLPGDVAAALLRDHALLSPYTDPDAPVLATPAGAGRIRVELTPIHSDEAAMLRAIYALALNCWKYPWKPSYLRNQGVLTGAATHSSHALARYGVTLEHGREVQPDALFERTAPTLIDIGFGRGESLIAVAQARPDWNVLGVEVHRPGIAWALRALDASGIQNVRIVRADVLWLLEQFIAGRVFSELRIFFPEPWPRAPERRLVRGDTAPRFPSSAYRRCLEGRDR